MRLSTTALHWITTLLASYLLVACVAGPSSGEGQAFERGNQNRESGDIQSARVHTELGAEYLRLKRYEVALEEFNTAIERSPSYALAYNGLGLVNAALGDTKGAESAFQHAIQLQPNNSESRNNYGRFLCDQGQFEASQKEFLLALKNPLYKTPQVAYYNAGVCALRAQHIPQAETYFSQALQADADTHPAAYQLALIQFNRQQFAAALNTLQRQLDVAPSPESLLLAVRLARALKQDEEARFYTVQLHKLFPNANETKQLLKMESSK